MQSTNFIPYKLLLQGYKNLTLKEKLIWKFYEFKQWLWEKFCCTGEDDE